MTTQRLVGMGDRQAKRASLLLPESICEAALGAIDRAAALVVDAGLSANAVTSACIALGAGAGVLAALGRFGPAAVVMAIASVGDALDGAVARRAGSVSVAGALLDASGDRYQELFFLGGVAVFFRSSAVALIVTLLALGGAFMVSYGSAKAEAMRAAVPPGAMRRAERAICFCLGALLTPLWQRLAHGSAASDAPWARALPVLAAVAFVAVVANVSAVRRLALLASRAPSSPGASRVLRRVPVTHPPARDSRPLRANP